ncbi:MAG: GFA family protein [Sneathiellales bacterium]|nr:GFA family protein [Sneathiellales bacterium]
MSEKRHLSAKGGCLCGGIRFEITKLDPAVIYCHCKQCRVWHGHNAPYTRCKLEDVAFSSDRTLKWFASSDMAKRGFCSECGSSLFWKENDSPYIGIIGGCLDEPTGLKGESHIFTGSKGDFYSIDDGLPEYLESDV